MQIKVSQVMPRDFVSTFAPEANLSVPELDKLMESEVDLVGDLDRMMVSDAMSVDTLIGQVDDLITNIVENREVEGNYRLIAVRHDKVIVDSIQSGDFYSIFAFHARSTKDAIDELNGKTATFDALEVARGVGNLFSDTESPLSFYILAPQSTKIVAVEDTDKGDGFFKVK